MPLQDPKNGYMLGPGQAPPEGLDPARFGVHEVPVVTLDTAVPGPVDLVKIDVEGAEEAVWRGMQGLIARSPGIAVLLEFNAFRCSDPAGLLGDIARRFALREIAYDGLAKPCFAPDLLARREDTMLYLSDREPA